MIQSTKITLSHFSEGGGGLSLHMNETLQCFKAAICLFAMAESNKRSHLHDHTVRLYNLISSIERQSVLYKQKLQNQKHMVTLSLSQAHHCHKRVFSPCLFSKAMRSALMSNRSRVFVPYSTIGQAR